MFSVPVDLQISILSDFCISGMSVFPEIQKSRMTFFNLSLLDSIPMECVHIKHFVAQRVYNRSKGIADSVPQSMQSIPLLGLTHYSTSEKKPYAWDHVKPACQELHDTS